VSDAERYSNLRELRGVIRYEWRARRAWFSKRAAIRGLWWTFVRRYPSELCNCGRPVSRAIGGTYWSAENSLWADVMGWHGWQEELGEMAYLGPPGTRCPRCFTERAKEKGLHLYWEPKVDVR
jgi:hypothetical protein